MLIPHLKVGAQKWTAKTNPTNNIYWNQNQTASSPANIFRVLKTHSFSLHILIIPIYRTRSRWLIQFISYRYHLSTQDKTHHEAASQTWDNPSWYKPFSWFGPSYYSCSRIKIYNGMEINPIFIKIILRKQRRLIKQKKYGGVKLKELNWIV